MTPLFKLSTGEVRNLLGRCGDSDHFFGPACVGRAPSARYLYSLWIFPRNHRKSRSAPAKSLFPDRGPDCQDSPDRRPGFV